MWPTNGQFTLGGIPLDINSVGQVAGRYGFGSGTQTPTFGVQPGRGFVWDPVQGMRDLGSLGGNNVEAVAINNAGQVVGTSETPTGGRAFLWDLNGGMRDLGSLGGTYSFGRDVNNSSQVVGTSWGPNNIGERAFLWDSVNGMRALDSPSGGSTRAFAINDMGQTVGIDFGLPNSQGGIAGMVIWDEETVFVPGKMWPFDINNRGQVVGYFPGTGGAESNAFIWDSTMGLVDLEHLLPPGSAWNLEVAHGINDEGQVVGHGYLNGEIRAFVMTPVPEPSTVVLGFFAAFVAAVLVARRVGQRGL